MKTNKIFTMMLLFATILLTGCGTIMHGPTQDIKVTSNPPGAIVTNLDFTCWIKTPGVMTLKRNDSTVLTANLYQYKNNKVIVYKEQKIKLKSTLTPWTAGNAAGALSPTTFFSNHIPGYYVLLIGDVVTGSIGTLVPNEVHFEMEPVEKKISRNKLSNSLK